MDKTNKKEDGKEQDKKDQSNPPCKHEKTKKERILGMDTGDKICLNCGELI